MLERGEMVDGRYEVEAMVGEGGLAQVYRVRHKALGSLYALKLLSWRKKALAERLLTEGRIQAQLSHPNIVSVIDLVQHDGQFGLLMEYVDNECLEDFVVSNGGLGVQKAFEMFAPILSALAAAHEAGVTHRDLKPANILLANGPGGLVPKVTDFGIAKVMAELAQSSTAIGSTMGTPGYLAPEQTEDSSKIDKRADVFALGAILYELITGSMAFLEDDGTVTVMTTSRVVPPALNTWIAEVPEGLDEVLAKAMAKNPADRFPSCIAFAEALFADHPALLSVASNLGDVTTTLSLSGAREEIKRSIDARTNSSIERAPTPPTMEMPVLKADEDRGPPWWVLLGVVLLVVGAILLTVTLAGVGAFGVKRGMGDPVETPPIGEAQPVEPSPTPATPAPLDPVVAEPVPVVLPVAAPTQPLRSPAKPEPVPLPKAVVQPQPVTQPQPVVAPVPVVVPDAVVQIVPVPAPVEPSPPQPAAVAEPVAPPPSPVVAPVPVVPAPVAPAPVLPVLAGSWVGRANKRPIRLQLTQTVASLGGRASFPGVNFREESIQGSVDASGRVVFTAGNLMFSGSVSGSSITGTYTAGGGKALNWSVKRR